MSSLAEDLGQRIDTKNEKTEKRSIEKRIFAAQKELDVSLKGDELIGAMRQCLHKQQLSLRLENWQLDGSEILVMHCRFAVRYGGTEEDVQRITMLCADFPSIDALIDFAWRTFLHGLFGVLPERTPQPVAPLPKKIAVAPRTTSELLDSL